MLKRKRELTAARVPSWHPNFRNFERLPDIKVVRTAFFINGAAVSITLALTLYFAFQEWQLGVIRGHIQDAESRLAKEKPASDQAVALFKKFQSEEAKFREIYRFITSRPLVSDLVLHLGATLPPDIALDTFDLRENGLILRLSVRGSPDAAAGLATTYLEQLKSDSKLKSNFAEAAMTSLTRNPATGRLAVEMTLSTKPAGERKQ